MEELNIPISIQKWKYNTPEPTEYNGNGSARELYSYECLN
jgi:hypothetical protein